MGSSESKPEPPKPLTYPPWREPSIWNAQLEQSLISEIQRLHPQKRPNLLIIGPVGAGKSSFINSVLSIGKGRKCGIADTAASSDSSNTVDFVRYTEKTLLKGYHLMDCMGIEAIDGRGFHPEDIIALLKGHVKKGYSFNPAKPISENDTYWKSTPEFKDQIHCAVFVISSKSIFGIPKDCVKKIDNLRDKLRREHIPKVLILTHVDLLCEEVRNDISKMFRSVKVQQAVNTASAVFGIDKGTIHPVKNYVEDIEIDPLTNIPILLALRQAMQYAEDRVDLVLDVDSDDSD